MLKKKTTTYSFSLLTGITILEKVIAFVFEAIIAAVIGTSVITDGYFTSSEFFTLVDTAFLSAVSVVALNKFSYYSNNDGEKKGFDILSDLLSFYFPIVVLLSFVILFAAKPLSYVIAPGYGDVARSVVIRCIKVMTITLPVVCITSVNISVLKQKKEFGITGLKSLFISVVGIVSVLVLGRGTLKNADVLSIAYVVSMVLYCIFVAYFVKKYGQLHIHKPVFNDELKNSFKMLLPLMVSYGVGRLALTVDKVIASTLPVGSVSALSYAHTLFRVVAAIFVTNLCTIILTDFNNLCAINDLDSVEKKLRRTVSIMTLILIPITIVTVFNSYEIVKIVYERGKFSPDATMLVSSVLLYYALNFIPVMIQGVYNQALYAFGDTVNPMKIAFLSVIVNFATSIPLLSVIGLPGIAIGTLVSTVVSVICERIALKKYLPHYKGSYSFEYLWKTLLSCILCIGVTFIVASVIHNALISFVVSTIVAFLSFLICLAITRESITVTYTKLFVGKVKRKS